MRHKTPIAAHRDPINTALLPAGKRTGCRSEHFSGSFGLAADFINATELGDYPIERVISYYEKSNTIELGEPGDYYTSVASEDLSIGDLVVSSPDMVSEGDTAPYFVSDGKDFTEEETE